MYGYNIFKAAIITAFNYVIFLKISGWSETANKKIIYGIIYVVVFSALIWELSICMEEPYKSLLTIVISGIYLKAATKNLYINSITYMAVSFAVSYILYVLTTVASLFITIALYWVCNGALGKVRDAKESVAWGTALLALGMEVLITTGFVRLKIKITSLGKGTIGSIGISLSGIVLIFYSMSRQGAFSRRAWVLFISGIAFSTAGLMNCFKTETIAAYNNKVRDLIEERLKIELKEAQDTNDLLENTAHRDAKRLPAYRRAVEELIDSTLDAEVKNKAAVLLKELKMAEQEQSQDVCNKLRKSKKLILTGMVLLDSVFAHMLDRAAQRDIDFDLVIGGGINGITSIITQTRLENLAADLIENAITATEYSCGGYKSILVYLWVSHGVFELRVDDSGLPFEEDIFFQLGKHRVTTHADTGGSGIGFMTVFESLRLCSASLIIIERPPAACLHSKSVVVRFDGKSKKTICSYRIEDITISNDGSWTIEDYR